jgi:hypothetical protein
MATRIAKNDTAHAIWLKFSKMQRLIGSSMIFIVSGMICRCCQESSAKCIDLYVLTMIADYMVDESMERVSRYDE